MIDVCKILTKSVSKLIWTDKINRPKEFVCFLAQKIKKTPCLFHIHVTSVYLVLNLLLDWEPVERLKQGSDVVFFLLLFFFFFFFLFLFLSMINWCLLFHLKKTWNLFKLARVLYCLIKISFLFNILLIDIYRYNNKICDKVDC